MPKELFVYDRTLLMELVKSIRTRLDTLERILNESPQEENPTEFPSFAD